MKNNGDMPAMALTGDAYADINDGLCRVGAYRNGMGLTKREHFAGLAMQGYLSMVAWSDGEGGCAIPDHENVARESVLYADALLKKLEQSK